MKSFTSNLRENGCFDRGIQSTKQFFQNRVSGLLTITVLLFISFSVKASTAASVFWPLVSGGNSTTTATTSGQVTGAAEVLGGTLAYGSGATASVGSPALTMQRIKEPSWPIETVYNSANYIQFSCAPTTGSVFTVDTISVTIGTSGGVSTLNADIYYSTDASFYTATKLGSINPLGNTVYQSFKVSSLGVVLNAGQTLYVRIYPWNSGPGVLTGKYITLLNFGIGGSTDPVPVASSIIWPCTSNLTSYVTTGTIMSGGTTTLSSLTNYGSLTYSSVAGQSIYTGSVWTAETAPAEGRYIQFAAAPKSGGVLSLDSVRLKLAAWSTNDLRVALYYSKNASFTLSTGTHLGSDISVTNASFSKNVFSVSDTVSSGEVVYFRLYPYSVSTSGDQWKLVGLDSISVFGKVTGVTADPPTVTTTAISNISTTFVYTGGTISSDGGATVTDRGIVYSTTNSTPTISDTKIQTGTGSGSFTTELTSLTAGATYYARAYAVNSAGTSYGSVVTFTTLSQLSVPTLTTTSISSILAVTATGGGNITAWGGSTVAARGICWSYTNSTPTINDSISSNGNGTGSYTCSLFQLLPSTTYYVRAYATNSTGTGYGPAVTFTTQAIAADVIKTVGKDACSDYNTVQAAFTDVPTNYTGKWIIYLKPGTYYEKCNLVSTKPNVYLIGLNADSCIITYDDYAGKPSGSGTIGTANSYSVAIDANDFYAQNITFQNTIVNNGKNTYASGGEQAVALRTKGDRQQYYNCKLKGYQDTYYTNSNGRIYMKNCYIEGSVDFIFGNGVMILDSCTTYVNRTGGVNCAPNTDAASSFGYVFRNCTLTSLASGAADFNGAAFVGFYLGRPWQNNPKAVYLYCNEAATVYPAGWINMTDGLSPYFGEYNCTGTGYAPTSRSTNVNYYGNILTDAQAATYTTANIFSKNTNSSFSYNWMPSTYSMKDTTFTCTSIVTAVPAQLADKGYNLGQNRPNPAIDATIIEYSIPENCYVSLYVTNIYGGKVIELAQGMQSAGTYEVSANISKLSKGIYFYTIVAGKYTATKKMEIK